MNTKKLIDTQCLLHDCTRADKAFTGYNLGVVAELVKHNTIDEACAWLASHDCDDQLVEEFRKAMER